MYRKIADYETVTQECNDKSDKFECEVRDTGKKVQKMETNIEETMEKLQLSSARMEEAEKEFRISVEKLASTIMKLALMSKEADGIVKACRHWESKTMNNEVEIEEIDTNLREARRIASDNQMKSDNIARSLSM